MYLSKINSKVVEEILEIKSEEIQCFFIRSNTGRWSPEDLKSLPITLFSFNELIIWGFSNVIRKNDPIFKKAAKRCGKDLDDDWELFGLWPPMNRYTFNKKKHVFGFRSSVSGFAKVPLKILKQKENEFFSMVNSSQFASECFLILQPTKSDFSKLDTKFIQKNFEIIVKYKTRRYKSQQEWDEVLPFRENAFKNIIKHVYDNNLIALVPVKNADVEVGFLVFTENNDLLKENPKDDRKYPLSRLSKDWTIGLLM